MGYLSSPAPAGYARGIVSARKSAEASFESRVEQQIRAAERAGRFEALPGAGRPHTSEDAGDPHWWTKQLLRREQVEAEVRRLNATAHAGPPTTQAPLDVEEIVATIKQDLIVGAIDRATLAVERMRTGPWHGTFCREVAERIVRAVFEDTP